MVIEQGEKMSALGLFNLADHNFIALVNARERSMDKLEVLIEKNRGKGAKSLEAYIDSKSGGD